MLFQLVCTDRRYARMNCFNIRELQGILKRRFFTDLVNSHEHKDLLEKSMIGLRYKTNSNVNLDPDMLSFYNFGIHNINVDKTFNFEGGYGTKYKTTNAFDTYFISLFLSDSSLSPRKDLFSSLYNSFLDTLSLIFVPHYLCLVHLPNLNIFSKLFIVNFSFNFSFFSSFFSTGSYEIYMSRPSMPYKTKDNSALSESFVYSESSSSQRLTRFSNPMINYDYKTGHYVGN